MVERLDDYPWYSEERDAAMPGGIDQYNLVLNRKRLQEFLERYDTDADVRDFLLLDALSNTASLGISSTGLVEEAGGLRLRPFRLWEYVWLFKGLELRNGGMQVLDLGGPVSHIVFLAALAGNEVLSIDIDPIAVEAGNRIAREMGIANYRAIVCDMQDLSALPAASFDRAVSCSVLEHLTGDGQMKAMSELGRVCKADAMAGFTFDYGPSAAGVNIHLPPPHDPPGSRAEAVRRLTSERWPAWGGAAFEDPVPGGLFPSTEAEYVIASMFMGISAGSRSPHVSGGPCLLQALSIPRLPQRAFDAASRAGREGYRIGNLEERCRTAEQAAELRLQALHRTEREVQELGAAAQRLREQLEAASEAGQAMGLEAERRLQIITQMSEGLAEREILRREAQHRLEIIEELSAALKQKETSEDLVSPPKENS